AAERARSGLGPTLVEALTYRIGAHSSSDDPSRYRDESVTEKWRRERDPLRRFGETLRAERLWTDADEARARSEIEAEVSAALARVEALPPPPPDSLFDDVFSGLPARLAAQRRELLDERSARAKRESGPST